MCLILNKIKFPNIPPVIVASKNLILMFRRQTETESSALLQRLPYYTNQYHINIFALVCTMAYSNKKIPQQDKTKTNYKCASTTKKERIQILSARISIGNC